MKRHVSVITASVAILLLTNPCLGQKFEAVHAVHFSSSDQARESLARLMKDDAMKDGRVTLYAQTFGEYQSSHIIVADFDSYDRYMSTTEGRLASHAWSRYRLETQGSEYRGSNLFMVVDDHGAPRYTADYLVAYLIHTTDPETYRSAIADLNKAIGNPGVLRLLAVRTGNTNFTHVVLIGGADFAAVNEYIDGLSTSDAFTDFVERVGDTREVVGVSMYRRVATWGK